MKILQLAAYALIGFVLYHSGMRLNDWHYWVVVVCTLFIDFASYYMEQGGHDE